jgi:hypothetical protein
MKDGRSNKKAFSIIAVLCVASFVLLSAQAAFYWKSRIGSTKAADKLVRTQTQAAAEEIGVETRKIEGIVRSIAADLGERPLSQRGLEEKLEKALADNPQLYDIGAAYAPGNGGQAPALYDMRYARKASKPYQVAQDASCDYTKESWYKDALGSRGIWAEPFRSRTDKTLVVVFALPFRSEDRGGVLYASVSIDTIRQFAHSFKFGDTGYCYILSRTGTFIYHPVKEAAESQKTVFQIARGGDKPKNKDFVEVTKRAIAGEAVKLDVTNPVTGQHFKLSYFPVPLTGWTLGAIYFSDEIFTRENVFRKEKMWIMLWLVIFLTLFSGLIFRVYNLSQPGLWSVSAIFSALCMAGAFYIWHLALSAPLVEENKKMVFTDAPSLSRFVGEYSSKFRKANRKAPSYIPTGIYVQSLEFINANNLRVAGYIWQKYQDGIHDDLERGFNMPEAKDVEIKEVYRRKTGKIEVIGWHFEATIREVFDYSKYPFDRPDIWIWLKYKDPTANVVLIPDLEAYKFITPAAMPGLQEDLAFPGYVFLGAFFDYEYHIRSANLGISSDDQADRTPEFYYNIIVRRNFVTPFVSRLFPLFIMFAILFVVQLMFSQDEEKKKAFGLNAFAVMGVVITFFFSTLLSHNSLRQELNVDKIIFIENFHFIAYLMLLLATIKTLLFIGGKGTRFVQYKQGLIPKLLYWPMLTGLVFMVSFLNFYR